MNRDTFLTVFLIAWLVIGVVVAVAQPWGPSHCDGIGVGGVPWLDPC